MSVEGRGEGAERLVREADQGKGSGETGRFPQRPHDVGFPHDREPKASGAHVTRIRGSMIP
jgi:hypothetical protein